MQAAVLGIVQGLGEFLPISSTAHLILVPDFFGFSDPGLSFDVALHLGTLLAIIAYFYNDWVVIFQLAFGKNIKSKKTGTQIYGKNILWLLAVATVPGVLAGYFLEEKAESIFRSPLVIAAALIAGGLILYLSDKFLRRGKEIKDLGLKDSVLIGLLQAVAIIPGVSRSGATIIGGLWRGLDREGAARFSFLMSTPVIFGAVVFQFADFFQGGVGLPAIVGILASAISGFLAIKYFLKVIHRIGYGVFFWYRLVLAILIITWLI